MRAKRDRSNRVQAPAEPEMGPGSNACFCRRMERQQLRKAATPTLYGEELPKHTPATIPVKSEEDIEEIGQGLRELLGKGISLEIRVIATGAA